MFRKSSIYRLMPFITILGIFLTACAGAATPSMEQASYDQGFAEAPEEAVMERDEGASFNAVSAQLPETRRIVIQDASMTIVVDDPSSSMESIALMAEEMGGFVISANLYPTVTI